MQPCPAEAFSPLSPQQKIFPTYPPKVVMDLGTEPLTRCFDGGDLECGMGHGLCIPGLG